MTEISKTDKLPPEHALLVQQSLLGRLNRPAAARAGH